MLLHLRSQAVQTAPPSLGFRAAIKGFAAASARPRLYRIAAALGRRLLRLRAREGWITRAPGMTGAWTRSRDLRAPARATFQDLWRARRKAKR